MINALNGHVVTVNEHYVVMETGGVEFTCEVSTQTASYFAQKAKEEKVRILTVLSVREDAMNLFGFRDESERECFLQLQTVPGIGAKQSLKILSAITVKDLILALDQRDISRLSKIPGVGAKSAQKLILQLRDTLVYTDDSPSGIENIKTESKKWNDLIESMTGMGFDKKVVSKALDELIKQEQAKLATMNHEMAESYLFPLLLRRLS